MPRLHPRLFRQAQRISPDLATLLPACKDLDSAINELRWIKAHVAEHARTDQQRHLTRLAQRRGRGEPLQYVLGSQPFGNLDIKCRPGVLIPRSETEAYTTYLGDGLALGRLLAQRSSPVDSALNIVDFCTGTGCIPLQLFAFLQRHFQSLNVVGVDVSPTALRLANRNYLHNVKSGAIATSNPRQSITFKHTDIFSDKDVQGLAGVKWHVMVSNPPYVSRDVWDHGRGHLGYSVRKYEPQLALVPGDDLPSIPGVLQEDIFYARLLDVAQRLNPEVLLLEVGEGEQAHRVIKLCRAHAFCQGSVLELWRDWPDAQSSVEDLEKPVQFKVDEHSDITVRGTGNIRAIFIKR